MRSAVVILLATPACTGLAGDSTLLVCTNANFCGRKDGFGSRAVETLRVLAPPGSLVVQPSNCLTKCSSGVNAKLVSNAELAASIPAYAKGKVFTGLNHPAACSAALDVLGLPADPGLVEAYCTSLEANLALEAGRASEALPLLSAAASYASSSAPSSSLPPTPHELRQEWAGSHWVESFYGSAMVYAGWGAEEADDGALAGRYGKAVLKSGSRGTYAGALEGSVAGSTFTGKWSEDGASGTCELLMAADGFSFDGTAVMGDEGYSWSAERRAAPTLQRSGEPRDRWHATVLSLLSRARRAAGGGGGGAAEGIAAALEEAREATRRCPFLPLAWEALAEAARAAGATADETNALAELLYLEPADSPSLAYDVASKRRQQKFELARLRRM